ncbi:retinoic acid receptor responder protein 2-like isoform X2 [Ranitomeya imitator]|uniref:retinoic acid receptor responder protein 2-like isoform X2 n=1 Tax=Ranitomeya imitator TaxID=111125 RepID=UPI001AA398D0
MTMTTIGRCWWIAALLVTAAVADVPVDSLTDTENKAVDLVRKDFHNKNMNKNAFQVTRILSNVNQKLSEFTFVQVKFTMKRTNCMNHEWMNEDCTPIMSAKKTYNCLGCFLFNPSGNLLKTGYQKCVRQGRANKEKVKKERREACAELTDIHVVGGYSFQRAPQGQYED